jgi:hypothetical protein
MTDYKKMNIEDLLLEAKRRRSIKLPFKTFLINYLESLDPLNKPYISKSPNFSESEEKCIVFGCSNRKGEGTFIGDLCAPCHKYITTGEIGHANSFLGKLSRIKKSIEKYYGWAIQTRSEREGLIGRYWWFNKTHPEIPIHMEGHRIALFITRREARENLPSIKKSFPRARVKRVQVEIKDFSGLKELMSKR